MRPPQGSETSSSKDTSGDVGNGGQQEVIYSDLVFSRPANSAPNPDLIDTDVDTTYAAIAHLSAGDHAPSPIGHAPSPLGHAPSPISHALQLREHSPSSPIHAAPRPSPFLDGLRLSPVRASPPNSRYFRHGQEHSDGRGRDLAAVNRASEPPRKTRGDHDFASGDNALAVLELDDAPGGLGVEYPADVEIPSTTGLGDTDAYLSRRRVARESLPLQRSAGVTRVYNKRPAPPPLPSTPRPYSASKPDVLPAIPARNRYRDLHSPFEPDAGSSAASAAFDGVDGSAAPSISSRQPRRQAPPIPPSPPFILPRRTRATTDLIAQS